MAKVFLRVYNREIESMIEGGQLDEAIAHCQNILKIFPMHIETYRLLGKAFLEGRKYADAADIFQRALMAVPDDFVSHVGMSIIRDDESKLDDAIWHMERAFEVQPSNAAIQGELRRLYGRRDGVEPSKIRLSRDALANMYSQGELFNQAIAEIRSVLAEDPNRPDLQVMLARAYYRSGQKVEAAEMASTLLKKYPYCMDALRILVDVLPGTGAADSTQMYRQRLRLLDPYSAYCIESVFTSDQVVDSTVSLDRLEFKPGPISASAQPDWASSLGIKLEGEHSSQNPPDWMQAGESADQPLASAPENPVKGPNKEPDSASGSVPEWMRSAGWQESAGTVQEGSTDSGEDLPDDSIAKAEIPDWLKSMAPTDIPVQPVSEPERSVSATVDAAGDGIPDWLKGMTPTAAADMDRKVKSEPAGEPQPKGEDGTPDWLTPIAPTGSADVSATQDQTPDWLKSMPPAGSADVSAMQDQTPDWLKPMPPAGSANVATPQDQTPVQLQPAGSDAAPDWLKSMTPAVEAVNSPIAFQEPVQPASSSEDDIPDWLKSPDSLPASDDTPVISPEPDKTLAASGTETPDWLKALASTESAAEPRLQTQEPLEAQPTNEEDIPDWLRSMAPTETTAETDPIPTLKAPEVILPEGKSTGLEAQPMETGDFIEQQKDIGARAEAAGAAAEVPGDSLPQPAKSAQPVQEQPVPPAPAPQEPAKPRVSLFSAPDKQFQPTGEVRSLNIEDDALGWLESLAAKQGAKPEELLTNPLDRSEKMPDWLQQPGEQSAEIPAVSAPEPANIDSEIAQLEPVNRFGETSDSIPVNSIVEPLPTQEEIPPVMASDSLADHLPESGVDDTSAWLEQLSMDQAGKVEHPLQVTENYLETTPGWIEKPSAEQPLETPSGDTAETVPEKNQDGSDITITSWLSKMDVEEALSKKAAEPPSDQQPATPVEELPDWLKGLEKKQTAPLEVPEVNSDLPEWLRKPIAPAEQDKPVSTLAENSSSEQEMSTWFDEDVPVTEQMAPTMREEWVSADSKPAADLASVPDVLPAASETPGEPLMPSDAVVPTMETAPAEQFAAADHLPEIDSKPASIPAPVPAQQTIKAPVMRQTGMLSRIPIQDKDAELLSQAQTTLDKNSLDEAMKQYSKLIKKGRLLDEVIHDLREAIYRYPVDVIVWQSLGDAYMRANRLQDALDAYTKAEELLR